MRRLRTCRTAGLLILLAATAAGCAPSPQARWAQAATAYTAVADQVLLERRLGRVPDAGLPALQAADAAAVAALAGMKAAADRQDPQTFDTCLAALRAAVGELNQILATAREAPNHGRP